MNLPSPNTCILDASALIAWLHRKPGWEQVQAYLPGAKISSLSYLEVVESLLQQGAPLGEIRSVLSGLVQVMNFSEEQVWAVGSLSDSSLAAKLSLAERLCLALAKQQQLIVLTARQDWQAGDLGVEIVQLR